MELRDETVGEVGVGEPRDADRLTARADHGPVAGGYVEDPVAKVKFPKFAAGATLEQGGQTYYFIDESTKAQFGKK